MKYSHIATIVCIIVVVAFITRVTVTHPKIRPFLTPTVDERRFKQRQLVNQREKFPDFDELMNDRLQWAKMQQNLQEMRSRNEDNIENEKIQELLEKYEEFEKKYFDTQDDYREDMLKKIENDAIPEKSWMYNFYFLTPEDIYYKQLLSKTVKNVIENLHSTHTYAYKGGFLKINFLPYETIQSIFEINADLWLEKLLDNRYLQLNLDTNLNVDKLRKDHLRDRLEEYHSSMTKGYSAFIEYSEDSLPRKYFFGEYGIKEGLEKKFTGVQRTRAYDKVVLEFEKNHKPFDEVDERNIRDKRKSFIKSLVD